MFIFQKINLNTRLYDDIKDSIWFSSSLVLALLAQKGLQIVDTIMLGQLGAYGLVAAGLTNPLYSVLTVLCLGIISALGVLIAKMEITTPNSEINNILWQGAYLVVALSLIFMLLAWYSYLLLTFLEQDDAIVDASKQYMQALLWGFPGLLGFFVMREYVSALSLPRIIVIVTIFAIPFNILLNYLLMYGIGIFPELGIAGVGYATTLVEWGMFIGVLIYALTKSELKQHLVIKPIFKPDFSKIRNILHLGVPTGVTFCLEISFILILAIFMGYLGVAALAAHQITLQMITIVFTFPIGIGMAIGLRVSRESGKQQFQRARQYAYIGLGLSTLVSSLFALIFFLFPQFIVDIFIDQGAPDYLAIRKIGVILLSIAAISILFDSIQGTLLCILRGYHDTFIPMLCSLFSYFVIGIGSSYYFSFVLGLGASGLWLGISLSMLSAALLLAYRFYTTKITNIGVK